MDEAPSGWLTIENLSMRSGVTTRNIRAYQSRGLLPPPVSRPGERAAFYTPEHLARLRLISRLQERGFSLAGIADLMEALAAGKSLEQVLGIESAIAELEEDQSRIVGDAELREFIPEGVDRDTMLKRMLAIGLIDRHERRYRLRNPQVFRLGVDAARAGIPADALLDEFVRLRANLHDIALRFVGLFNTYVLQPFLTAGMPKDDLVAIVEQLTRLRQLALQATDAMMRQAMADEIEAVERTYLPSPPATTDERK